MGALRTFLLPILSPPGASAGYGRAYAKMRLGQKRDGLDPEFKAISRQYANRLSRLIREPVETAPYPEPDTLWDLAKTLRFGGLQWAWAPVLYFASGHFRPLVEAIATVNTVNLAPGLLYDLVEALPGAVEGDVRAHDKWTLQYGAREAFLEPEEAAGRMRFPLPDDLYLAYVIADHFELSFALRRSAVLEYVGRWVASLQPNQQRRERH